jgi:hypothetical protein
MMRPLLQARIPLFEDRPVPVMPWHLLAEMRAAQWIQSMGQRLANYVVRQPQPVSAAPMPQTTNDMAEAA